jgi:hypothetical protein
VKLDERIASRREPVGLARPVDHERIGDEREQAVGVRVIERGVDLVDQTARVLLRLRRFDLGPLRRRGRDGRGCSAATTAARSDGEDERDR